ncbi:MAG: hypothetical protein AAGG44_05750 [Planctomycetota bacterium]
MNENPYGAPGAPEAGGISGMGRDEALAKVKTPATFLLITGILSVIGSLLTLAMPSFLPAILQSFIEQMAQDPNFGPEQQEQFDQLIQTTSGVSMYISGVIGLIGGVIICLGAMKMKSLQSFGLAMAGCICAIVPYFSACCGCIFPIAIGIWGIVVIVNQDVKQHFS